MALLKLLTRVIAVVRKELIDVIRRPGAVLSLIPSSAAIFLFA